MIDYAKLFILGGIFLAGASFGWYFPHRALVEYKTSVEVAAKAQEEKVKSIRSQQELVTKGIQNEYEAKLSAIRAYYGGMHNSSSGAMPSLSNPSAGINGSPADQLLACAATTQQLVSLQEWVKEQSGL